MIPAWLSNVDGAVWAVLAFAVACAAALLIAVVTETRLPDAPPPLDVDGLHQADTVNDTRGDQPC